MHWVFVPHEKSPDVLTILLHFFNLKHFSLTKGTVRVFGCVLFVSMHKTILTPLFKIISLSLEPLRPVKYPGCICHQNTPTTVKTILTKQMKTKAG